MGGVVVIKADVEPGEILLMFFTDPVNQLLGRDAFPLGTEHNGGAVGIIGANVVASVASHILIAHPDIGLNVFQQMAQVNGAVGVGQCAGNQNIALLL